MTEQKTQAGPDEEKAAVGGRRGPAAVRQILAFGLETALLFAVAYSAIAAFPGHGALAAIAALAVTVGLWSFFMAPRAKLRLPWPLLPVVAACAFLAGAAALTFSGLLPAALILAAAAAANLVWDLASGHPAAGAAISSTGSRPTGRRAAGR
ncbi:DUF2568 domain-containing protein [Arthrobacter jiangjiafuii]|uniref:DUF2568 domain-containing protein n=1 Tax=Arthrobacter jiangjiafuii TaxID=2817475 RepID=A0A975R0B6_9MICC|nr:DUF2568 domain-containing protein [Arthrobacter jiangjiafuii]MBP3044646.1 DUF2568 domain-containing protein [Arthrobacter jiangjiafuii]QWC09261.1 DUF2568 domain-containing protein [Arthrobacter jiangjiafuii]